jgi:hypothetical protein
LQRVEEFTYRIITNKSFYTRNTLRIANLLRKLKSQTSQWEKAGHSLHKQMLAILSHASLSFPKLIAINIAASQLAFEFPE